MVLPVQPITAQPSSTAPLRVLQIHNFYRETGGEDVVVRHEAALLQQAGVEVKTWYLYSESMASQFSLWQKFALAWRQAWNPAAVAELKRRLAESPVDLIHVHNVFPLFSPAILRAAQQLQVPVVLTVHNFRWCHPAACIRQLADVQQSLWRYAGKAWYRRSYCLTWLQLLTIGLHRWLGSYLHCDLLISPSGFVRQALLLAGVPPERAFLKWHSTPMPPDNTASAQTKPYLLFVGRADDNKGLRFLLALWQQQSSLQQLPLYVAGVTTAQAQQLCEGDLPANVHCYGVLGIEELASLYRHAQLLVVPSLVAETFGNVVIEAFSQGTPCLVSDLGALPELVLAGHNSDSAVTADAQQYAAGAVFRAGDGGDFLRQLQQLLAEPARLAQMREIAYRRYLQCFQPSVNQQALLACYQYVLNRQGM